MSRPARAEAPSLVIEDDLHKIALQMIALGARGAPTALAELAVELAIA